MNNIDLVDTPLGAGVGTTVPSFISNQVNMERYRTEVKKFIYAFRANPANNAGRIEGEKLVQSLDSATTMARLENRQDVEGEIRTMRVEVVGLLNQNSIDTEELEVVGAQSRSVEHGEPVLQRIYRVDSTDQIHPCQDYIGAMEEFNQRLSDVESTTVILETVQQQVEKLKSRVDTADQTRDTKYNALKSDLSKLGINLKALEIKMSRLSAPTGIELIEARLTKLEQSQGMDVVRKDLDILKTKVASLGALEDSRQTISRGNNNNAQTEPVGTSTIDTEYVESVLARQVAAVTSITSTNMEIGSEPLFLKDLVRNELPSLERATAKLQDTLDKYVRIPNYNVNIRNNIMSELELADKWVRELRCAYSKHEVYNFAPQTREVASEIGMFSGSDEMVVYDFLKRFATYTSAPTNLRADRLYHHHLSDSIRNRIPHLATDLKAIRQYLIDEYGRIEYIVEQAVVGLEKKKAPTNSSVQQRFEVLTLITNALTKLINIGKHPEIDSKALDDYLSTNMFLTRVVKVLPENDQEEFLKTVAAKGLDARHIKGKLSFDALLSFTRSTADAIEQLAKTETNRPKAIHSVYNKENRQEEVQFRPHQSSKFADWGGERVRISMSYF